jgi:eukaryotic-like serine/threonine-protein kinase
MNLSVASGAWGVDHMGFHVGQTFGDYSITGVLGAGGMGRVYKVEHSLTKRTESMKVLSAELASDIQIKRFEREMRSLARLNHPNIAALHNAVHAENQLILLMEFIEGQTLESMFGGGRLPLDMGVGYIRQMLSALGYAHRQGVVHRDVTPANVIVTGDCVKLTDFGLSKSFGDSLLTNCGEVLGSLPYLAPEQLKGTTQPDRRSDLYSVGAILYEHLTGQQPFGPNRRLAPVLTDSEGDPKPPSQVEPGLSPQWDEIVRRALARDPAQRYQSAEEFLDAIALLEQPTAVADLPLPQLRTLGIAVAVFAGLVLALAVSPALNRFRSVAPAIEPWQRLHIAPPGFATAMTPRGAPAAADATERPAKRPVVQHAKRDARPAEVGAVVPVGAVVQVGAVTEAGTANSSAAAEAPKANPEPDVNAPVAADAAESGASQDPAPAKRHFWSKLNVFKKKSADASDKQ